MPHIHSYGVTDAKNPEHENIIEGTPPEETQQPVDEPAESAEPIKRAPAKQEKQEDAGMTEGKPTARKRQASSTRK